MSFRGVVQVRILHLVSGLEKASGVSVFVGELASQQAADGHDVSILVKSRSPLEHPISPSVRIVTKEELSTVHLRLLPSPEIVHLHALWDPWLTKTANSFRKQGAKIVWSPHGMLTPWALKNKWPKKVAGLLAYQYWSLHKADLIHVTADSEVEDVRRLWLKNRIVLAPLGVHINGRVCAPRAPQKYVCFVSRVQRKKGLPNLLNAWAKLPSDLKLGWKVKIAGPDQDNHTAELKTLANELKITDEIDFLGPVYDEAKDKLYAEAAFSVLPTHSENFGSVVIESLAQGTPVICTKGAPWKDLVDYKCGWWIDIGVEPLVAALKEAIQQFNLQPSSFNLLGQNGRALVERKYTWESVAQTMENSYINL